VPSDKVRIVRLVLPLLLAWSGGAAVLSIPGRNAAAGELAVSSVTLSTEGAQISSLQFDLEWDAGLGVQMAVGSGLVDSGKLLYTAQLTPRSVRVLIAREDRGVLVDGDLLRLFVVAGSATGSFQIKLANLNGATPDGSPVAVGGSSATIGVTPAAGGATLLPESVLNAASLRSGAIAPGEIITLLGVFGILTESPASVVTVNGSAASVLYALGNQINTVTPLNLDLSSPAEVAVFNKNGQIARVLVPVAAASPAVFTQNGTGIGPGAILNEDYSLNSTSNPANEGSIVMIYGTGFGPLSPPGKDGEPGVLSATALPVTAKIGGLPADIFYAGAAPALPNGVVQINVRVPVGISTKSIAALELRAGNFEISVGVSLAVR